MTRHMLRSLEDLSPRQLAELSAEVTAEQGRREREIWGVATSTSEHAQHATAAAFNTRKVFTCYIYLTTEDETWHCDRSCEKLKAHSEVQERPVKSIIDAGNLYVADWLAEQKSGPCSHCTPNIWGMVRRQQPVQSSSSGSGIPSVSFGSSEALAAEY